MNFSSEKHKIITMLCIVIASIACAAIFSMGSMAAASVKDFFLSVSSSNSVYGLISEDGSDAEANFDIAKITAYDGDYFVDSLNNLHIDLYYDYDPYTLDSNTVDTVTGDKTEYIFTPVANSSYNFINWTFNGTVLTPNIKYTKAYSELNNGNFIANFEEIQYSISGTVTDQVTGKAISNAEVIFADDAGNMASTHSDTSGAYSMALTSANVGSLAAAADTYYANAVNVTDTSKIKKQDIQLTPMGDCVTLSGIVSGTIDGSGIYPLGGADVYYATENGVCHTTSLAASDGTNPIGYYSMKIPKNLAGTDTGTKDYYTADSKSITAEQTATDVTQNLVLTQSADCINIVFKVEDPAKGKLYQPGNIETGYSIFNVSVPKTSAVTYTVDEYSGKLVICYDNNKSYVITVDGEIGYAYYDWTLQKFNGEALNRKTTGTITENVIFTATFIESGDYIATSDSEYHEYFSLTTATSDYQTQYKDNSKDMSDSLYKDTIVTVKDDAVYFKYANTEYTETFKLKAVPTEKGKFKNWTINGEEVNNDYSYTVKVGDLLNIQAFYEANPDVPEAVTTASSNANSGTKTGDSAALLTIISLIAVAGGAAYLFKKKHN